MTVRCLIASILSGMALVCSSTCPAGEQPVAVPAVFPPIPNPGQITWHQAEYRMFIHFGMKTFYPSDDHMGYGKEDPMKFNPRLFDADQWVGAAKAGGFEGIVLTTKHHDGFCNWPTDTTDHCVRSSPWKNGGGDVVGELVAACRRGGLTFGFYVSIIDKHFEVAGSPKHDAYGDYYLDQITELSTRYGAIDEYWFDGYKSDKTKIDYRTLATIIRENQPGAVVYDSGTLVKYLPDRSLAWPGRHGGVRADQNYRQEIEGALCWYPNEPSTILQGNWFHNRQPMVSLNAAQDQYLSTVGHGVTPLMNVSPNEAGLIDPDSVERLKELKAWVNRLHANDLARRDGVRITTANVRGGSPAYGPEKAIDGDPETYYATDDGVTDAVIELDLGGVREIDGFILQEYIPLGQRINGYRIECRRGGRWTEVFKGTRIGYKRIILEGRVSAKGIDFPAADRVRLTIERADACPLINTIQIVGEMK